ncbi:MAG: HIT family protein [Candidatus Pacearchaeota archaeon]|nr:MAG: HIT family protein [Candidatus Pacearchaeota archaeon]
MPDCIFCKIATGEIPSYKIYEDDDFFAFLDIQPVNPGHALVIPKKHYENLLDIPQNILCEMMGVVQKLSKTITEVLNAPGFNIGINNKKIAGQSFFHLHVHIMPRFEGDGYKLWPGKVKSKEELQKIADKIKNSL